jgi:serine/threonine protein kinase
MSLKKFEIQEMVAKGGMAEVYRAKTVGLQGFEKEVCVKKILPHLTEDEGFVNMFINEAKLAATLSFANIVSVHDLCVSANGEYFIVMEYVHGKDLSDVIRAAQLTGREIPPDFAVAVCREVCKGLQYAHTKTDPTGARLNIIHRDISPHNVLVSFQGEVKLTDFGIAKASSIMNKTAVGILKGKYGYMSPEQARGQPLDHRSDIFNTGIVLYELIVGERCFAGSSDFSTLNLMRNATVTPPTKINTKISKDLEAIVLKALSADRNDRYADAMEMESALARYAESRGKRIGVAELGAFMQQLFSSTEAERQTNSTGVLSLASIAAPAARPESSHGKLKPRPPTERAPELANQSISDPSGAPLDEPGKEARERAKKRADKRAESAAAHGDERKQHAAQVERANHREREQSKHAEEAPRERKPARIKQGPAESADKAPEKAEAADRKKGKQLSDSPKKPVGRRDLRPGLTAIKEMSRPQRRRSLIRGAALVLLAGAVGAFGGYFQRGSISRQSTFRDMELATRDNSLTRRPTVTLLITSDPPGASVLFDKIELSEKTPLTVERDRDGLEHTIEFVLDGFHNTMKTMKYGAGPLTRYFGKLEGDDGALKVQSKPTGVTVRVDGKFEAKTPASFNLTAGKHEVEIGDENSETVQRIVEVPARKTLAVMIKVPPKGSMASLLLNTEPQAQIFLDDEATGRWTNDGALKVQPGTHRIGLLVRENQPKQEIVVRVKNGERKEIFLDLTGSS